MFVQLLQAHSIRAMLFVNPVIVALSAIAVHVLYYIFKNQRRRQKIVPKFELTKGRHIKKLEKFGDYVVRQLGLSPQAGTCISDFAEEYLTGEKNGNENGLRESLFSYLAIKRTREEIISTYNQLDDELHCCMLSYFAFHWKYGSEIVGQVLRGYSSNCKLRAAVISATRNQRFEKITKTLRTKQAISTLLNEINSMKNKWTGSTEVGIVVPAHEEVRSPVLLLIGGGMGAGKSTVVKDIMKSFFWSSAAKNAVVVEADAFREMDVVYQALNSYCHDDILETAELVHQKAIDAASSLLVTALNEGRDVIFDGTMSWEPFVVQTIAMARDVHRRRYRMGPGYTVEKDGSVQENYWEAIETGLENDESKVRKPYRIELIGVICEPQLAVLRGFRRAIITKRAVRVNSQLKSHKKFASALPRYVDLVDHVEIYNSNKLGGPPQLIGWKDKNSDLLVSPEAIKAVKKLSSLNHDAKNVYELYKNDKEHKGAFDDAMFSSERLSRQRQLKEKIQSIEAYLAKSTVKELE